MKVQNVVDLKCPQCGSKRLKEVEQMGLCPLNEWIDIVCENCGYSCGKHSKVHKEMVKKRKQRKKIKRLENSLKIAKKKLKELEDGDE